MSVSKLREYKSLLRTSINYVNQDLRDLGKSIKDTSIPLLYPIKYSSWLLWPVLVIFSCLNDKNILSAERGTYTEV